MSSIEDELKELETEAEETKKKDKKPEWLKILWADSKDKPLSDYTGHALNTDGSESTSRIIRGVEGLLGSVDKAVIDIAVGTFQKISGWFKKAAEDKE